MRNRTYGGVRGRKTKVGRKLSFSSYSIFLLRAFMGLGLSPCLFLFQGKSQHHTIVAVCQRSDCFKGAIVALAGNQGNQL